MFRTLLIEEGERLSVLNHVLQIEKKGKKIPIPINDIYCVILDNIQAIITTTAINEICETGGHIVICNNKHIPSSVIYPEMIHYSPYTVAKRQLKLTQKTKNTLWNEIIKAKLQNQATIIKYCTGDMDTYQRIIALSQAVTEGDRENREGIGAKLYFRHLFGSNFIRMEDDGINHALNYGYTIIRTAMIKTLYTFGYYPAIGIHHIGIYNPFNLGDDLMEPFRPIVDMWTDIHHNELLQELTKQQRHSLVNLLNQKMIYDNSLMKIRNVMARYVKNFTTAIEKEKIDILNYPTIPLSTYKDMKEECHEL